MIRSLIVVLLTLATSITYAAEPVVIGHSGTMRSVVLDEERAFHVYLPASYAWAEDREYPVLYVLDGQTQAHHTATSAEFLGAHGEIPEMIVVAIDSTVRVRDFTQSDWSEAWVGGGGARNFRDFLSTELIPHIEKGWRTNGFRVLAGHSAGGQFVLYALTESPDLFHGYFAFAPSLHWDGNLPQRSLEQSFRSREELRTFVYVARSDDAGQALADYDALVETLRAKAPRGLRWYSAAFPDETHTTVPLLAQIDALRRLYDGYRFHPDVAANGIAYADAHFERVSKVVGWQLPVPEHVINTLGYAALQEEKIADAIALFERNVTENPSSPNAWDSLADGLAAASEWSRAAAAEQKAVDLGTRFNHPNLQYFVTRKRDLDGRARDADAAGTDIR